MAATVGNLYLVSSDLQTLVDETSTYEETMQSSLYAIYKAALKMSETPHFRGEGAEKYKTYLKTGCINTINGLLNHTTELSSLITDLQTILSAFESSESGRIKETQIDEIKTALGGYKSTFETHEDEFTQALAEAANYITTVPLNNSAVITKFEGIDTKLAGVKTDLEEVDATATEKAEEFRKKLVSLNTMMLNTMSKCFSNEEFVFDSEADLQNQSWYIQNDQSTLDTLLAEDPFSYDGGYFSLAEKQWARGCYKNVFAYGDVSFLSGMYEMGTDGNTHFLKANGSLALGSFDAQFTDYAKFNANGKLLYGNTDLKAGWGNGYYGFHAKGDAAVAKAESSLVLGVDNLNVNGKVDAKFCAADGKAELEFDHFLEDGTFAIGFDGNASLAGASASVGVNGFSVPTGEPNKTQHDGYSTTTSTSLLGAKVTVKADVGGGAGAFVESKKALEFDVGPADVNINATTIKLNIQAVIGAKVDVTVPTIWVSW